MFKVIVTHSDDPDSQSAVDEILAQCATDLAGVPQAGILFAAIDFEHALILNQIHQVYPDLDLIGCTTDGEISSRLGFQQDSLTLMLFCSDTVKISAGVGYAAHQDPIAAAQQAVQQATASLTSTDPQLCILLPASYTADGSTTSGGDILAGLQQALGRQIPIIGGAAGDQYRFKKTYQFFRNQVLTDALPILIFSGDIQFSYGIGCGWTPIGNTGIVTKSKDTTLYEIDGKPALEFYQRYLGDRPPTAENPLAVYEEGVNHCYMRAPNLYDQDSGTINFLGNIPEQATVQITDINRDEVIQAAETSFNHALSNYPGQKPQAILLFSCCCRRWLLGTRVKEEYQLVKNAFSTDLPICGFYTYGEFAPLEPQGETFYHQETFVTLLLGTQDQA
jgi:hypothetical protein